jgi:hypothetical protein
MKNVLSTAIILLSVLLITSCKKESTSSNGEIFSPYPTKWELKEVTLQTVSGWIPATGGYVHSLEFTSGTQVKYSSTGVNCSGNYEVFNNGSKMMLNIPCVSLSDYRYVYIVEKNGDEMITTSFIPSQSVVLFKYKRMAN